MNARDPAVGAGHAADGKVVRDPPHQARLRQLAEEQTALRRVATLVAGGEPPERLFAAVAAEAGQVLHAEQAYIDRCDPDGTLNVVAAWASGAAAAVAVGTGLAPAGGT